MRGRELGDTRTHLGFCRSSRHRRLGAAGNLDFNLDGTASRGIVLHAHDGSSDVEILVAGQLKSVARQGATGFLFSIALVAPWLSILLYGLASRKSFTIGTMT